jgi:tRNA dimethylallyltransferase
MDIGTAKPTLMEQREAVHDLIDIVDPSERYSAHRYRRDALDAIRRRHAEGKRVVVCGGTGLYYEALSRGLGTQVPTDQHYIAQLEKRAENEGYEAVYRELCAVDPQSAERIHPRDVRRVTRALQVYHQTGYPLSSHHSGEEPPEDIVFKVFILEMSRGRLYRRINDRVQRMFQDGLEKEFMKLIAAGYHRTSPGLLCVGYREQFAHLDNEASLETVKEQIARNTRRLAKRQCTWFGNRVEGRRVSMEDSVDIENAGDELLSWISSY